MFLALGLAFGLAQLGCGSDAKPVPAPEFKAGQGQSPTGTIVYAPGPYGVSKGSTIANYQFVGFPDAKVDKTAVRPVQLADFYNPTGNDVFPDGSPYGAGTPKPKALLIDVASVWCQPCNIEAGTVLPGEHLKYKPQGGEFLLQLADGPTQGVAATTNNLYNWVTKYKVDYPATVDPSSKLSALFEQDAFPANMIIKTQNMQIIDVIAGVPDALFWSKFQKVLDGQL